MTPPWCFFFSFFASILHHLFPLSPLVDTPPLLPPPPPPPLFFSCGGSRIYILIHQFASRQRREWMARCQHHELPWRWRAETAAVCWPLHHREQWAREEKKTGRKRREEAEKHSRARRRRRRRRRQRRNIIITEEEEPADPRSALQSTARRGRSEGCWRDLC